MKLVEILARELKEWPGNSSCAWQDSDGEVRFCNATSSDFYASAMCDDHAVDRVTRDNWVAKRRRIRYIDANVETLVSLIKLFS